MTDWQNTPFADNWSDPAERERYRQHAREVYDKMKDLRSDSRRYHVDYGKWLIASLLALHGGAIFVISSLAKGDKPIGPGLLIGPAMWNLAGIVFILFAGCMAWLNFQLAERLYDRWSDPAMLYRRDMWPGHTEDRYDGLNATLWLAASAGVLSIWSFVASAAELRLALLPT
jgi:hypothetical protein